MRLEMENTIIRVLIEEEISEIYQKYFLKDFPPEEQKPLELILQRCREKTYICYGLFENTTLVAYAFFACGKNHNSILMDYLAVCANQRSKGYEGTFLKKLTCQMPNNYDGILFEVESGLTAKSEKELENCKRRMSFYLKNGLHLTKISVSLYGVDLVVMYLQIKKDRTQEKLYEDLENIYQYLYTKEQREEKVRIRFNSEIQLAEELKNLY